MKNLFDYEKTQSATADLPFGAFKDESSPGQQDGTDIVAAHIQDIAYPLYQILQLAGIVPNGELEDGNTKTQFIQALTNIGIFRYSDKSIYNKSVFVWNVLGSVFALYRSKKDENASDLNDTSAWKKILEIGSDDKINFFVDANLIGTGANPDLSNLTEAGEAHFANPDLSNLSATGLDKINQSKALETGAVSSDADVYADIQKYAHSTFDLSKFKVVGSPNITDDGVASGFSNANYISNNISIAPENSLLVVGRFLAATSAGRDQCIFEFSNDDRSIRFNLNVNMAGTGISSYINSNLVITVNNIFNVGTWNDFKIIINNSNYQLYINKNLIGEYSVNVSSLQFGDKCTIGYAGGTGQLVYMGSIDLKSIAIWTDGVPVFSGNKTGLDVIKPDNYEVVGTPTITDDGVMSTPVDELNYNNYVRSLNPISLTPSDSFTILAKLPCKNTSYFYRVFRTQQQGNTDVTANWNLENRNDVGSGGTGFRFVYYTTLNETRTQKMLDFQIPEVINADVTIKIEYNQPTSKLEVYKYVNNGYELVTSADISGPMNYVDNCYLYFGRTNGYSLDLNDFKLYINGDLAYQPCLKVPYTLSETGSKIVDVAYRDRVQDMYKQYGYAPYYTIDEENQNFTLPMGEIYGMIAETDQNAVHKTGDETISGLKTFNNSIIAHNSPGYTDRGVRYLSNQGTVNWCQITQAWQVINGEEFKAETLLKVSPEGKKFFDFPKCTEKATTTSSASSENVAVVVQNYVNGNSWYRVWSDGWIEQGGITSQTNTTINFLKSFSNTNYIFTATKRNPTTDSWGPEKGPIGTSGAKVSSIITASYTDNYPLSWRACGY